MNCTRKIQFCASHRLLNHQGRCRFVHGHNYIVEVELSGPLDDMGMVVDFTEIKNSMGKWIDEHWDHSLIIHQADQEMIQLLHLPIFKRHYIIPCNPTAENMANYLLDTVAPQMFVDTSFSVIRITVWETENSYATARRE
jgi:6-pyruvoyltetrahydropterin/6-carboxytetrahydropterin synthase